MFEKKDFIFTSESTPAIDTDLSASTEFAFELIGVADAINVTDSPNCKTRLNSLIVASELKRNGLDVILQLTGRDRNLIALESELLGALSVGINKILCLSGDQPGEDGPKVVNELDSNGLINLCTTMTNGSLSDGTQIKNHLPIYPGAADDIYTQLSSSDTIQKLISKIDQGAKFIQTQYCFDLDAIERYAELINQHSNFDDCFVLIGMGPLKSAKQADWMRKNLWGVNISDDILYELENSNDPIQKGENICIELIEKIKDFPAINGVHLMGPNCEKGSARIISHFK